MCFSGNENSIVNTAKSRVHTRAPHCWDAPGTKTNSTVSITKHPKARANSGKSVWRVRVRCFGFNIEALPVELRRLSFALLVPGVCAWAPSRAYAVRCTISIHRRRTINCVLRKIFVASMSSSALAAAALSTFTSTAFWRPYTTKRRAASVGGYCLHTGLRCCDGDDDDYCCYCY